VRDVFHIFARHPSFALLWASRMLSVVAAQILIVAIGWLIYDITNNPLDLGLVGLFQFLPIVSLTLLVGQVADRYDRRRVVSVCRLIQAAAGIMLAAGTLGGWLDPVTILAIVAATGAARAFEDPTTAALMPGLVPTATFPRAMVLWTMASQVARISGPALGGLLYLFGPATAFVVGAVFFVVAALLALFIRPMDALSVRAPFTLYSVFAGLAFTWRSPLILGSISLDLFVVLLGGATALLPIYARDILQTGPEGLGLLRSAPAVGALMMSLTLTRFPVKRHVGPMLFAAVIVFGLATVVFGISTSLPVSLAALMVLGAANVISVVIRHSLVQLRTPNEMRGRVSAVHSLFTGTSNQLGDFESGLLAALIGTVPAVLVGGIGTVLVALLWMVLFPDLRRVQTLEAPRRSRAGSALTPPGAPHPPPPSPACGRGGARGTPPGQRGKGGARESPGR
jgi:MFS family permease